MEKSAVILRGICKDFLVLPQFTALLGENRIYQVNEFV